MFPSFLHYKKNMNSIEFGRNPFQKNIKNCLMDEIFVSPVFGGNGFKHLSKSFQIPYRNGSYKVLLTDSGPMDVMVELFIFFVICISILTFSYLIHWVWPLPSMPVANKGLGRDFPHLKM